MRDQRAQASASCASATCRPALLSSSTRCATKLCESNSWLRLRLAWAIDTWACACLISARCSVSSSCTSTCPLRTAAPSAKPISRTRPATSGRIMTLWRERKVPTDWASSCNRARSALATSTPATRGAVPAPADAAAAGLGAPACAVTSVGPCGRDWYHHAPADAAAIPTTATTECIAREAMGGNTPSGWLTEIKCARECTSVTRDSVIRPVKLPDFRPLMSRARHAQRTAPARPRGWPACRRVRCQGHRSAP